MSTSKAFVSGQVFTAAQANDFPQGVLALATATADVGPTSGTTELDVVTASAVTIAQTGRYLKLTFAWRGVSGGTAADTFTMRIKEGATVLMEANLLIGAATGHHPGTMTKIVASPTAASHTYKATILRALGTGTVSVQGNANYPIQLVVEDVGQV